MMTESSSGLLQCYPEGTDLLSSEPVSTSSSCVDWSLLGWARQLCVEQMFQGSGCGFLEIASSAAGALPKSCGFSVGAEALNAGCCGAGACSQVCWWAGLQPLLALRASALRKR